MDCRFSKTNWLQIWTADYGYASLKNLGCPIGPGWMYNVRFWKSPTQVVCVGGSDAIHFPAIMHVHILAKKTHITWQLWWISTFNPQAHFSNHDDDRRNSSQLIDKTTKEKMGSTTKIGNHFMGRNMMPGIHIYLQTKPLSSASQKPRLPPYKSVMLCWQKHGWWKITETPDESCWHMPVSNSFVMRLECVDFMGFACCFTNQISTRFCQERANKGGDISTWWANYVFCSDSCYNNLFLSYTLFLQLIFHY
jgi:hypothetical protein